MSLPESTRVPDGLEDVADALAGRMDATVGELVDLARIPSISAPGHDRAPVRRSAERTARLLEDAGRLVRGGPSVLIGPGSPLRRDDAQSLIEPVREEPNQLDLLVVTLFLVFTRAEGGR